MMLEFFKSAWGIVWGFLAGAASAVRDVIRWAWKPENRWKAAALVLATCAGIGFLNTYRANQRIVVITGERDLATTRLGEVSATLKAERKEWDLFRSDWAAQQKAHAAALEAARAESAEAEAEADAKKRKAEASSAGWKQVYANKDEACKAAIATLDAACPFLKGY